MGTVYKVECKRCGTQFIHSSDSNYGVLPTCVGCGDEALNQRVIKCPGCQSRLNTQSKEFRDQVVEETNWE